MQPFRSGFVAIIGKPNVGKSTLLNALIGEKVSIVSSRPQTTRKRAKGIKNLPDAQIVFIDTPGLHKPLHKLGARMVQEAEDSLKDIDVAVLVTESKRHSQSEERILKMLKDLSIPVILAINKIDLIKKPALLPLIEEYNSLYPFGEIIPISAKDGSGLEELTSSIVRYLPEGPAYYDTDAVTDQYERFMASEIIRERVMENTREEVPHSVAVNVTSWKEREDGLLTIHADILVEREGQKGIIIGKKGMMLKKIGTEARLNIEALTGKKVYLELWMKVRKDWSDDEKMLQGLGY